MKSEKINWGYLNFQGINSYPDDEDLKGYPNCCTCGYDPDDGECVRCEKYRDDKEIKDGGIRKHQKILRIMRRLKLSKERRSR